MSCAELQLVNEQEAGRFYIALLHIEPDRLGVTCRAQAEAQAAHMTVANTLRYLTKES